MLRRILTGLAAGISISLLVAGLVFAFNDSQASTGQVNATSGNVELYICEASEGMLGPECASDDSGEDETIFQGTEDLLPGQEAHGDIRLKNVGTSSWDVVEANAQISIASDPGNDCNAQLASDDTFGFTAISTRAPVATIPVGRDPGSVAVDPNTNRIYVVNRLDNSVSAIDGLTNAEIDTDNDPGNGVTRLSFGGALAVAVNPATNRIYVTGGSITLRVIDGATYSTVSDVSVASGTSPGAVAVNPVTNRIYVSSPGGPSVIDGSNNEVIANAAVGASAGGLAVDSVLNRVYQGSGSNVFVVDGGTNTQIDTDGSPGNGITPITVPVPSSIGGIAVNQNTHRVYVALGQNAGGIAVIDGSTFAVSQIVSTGGSPVDVAVDNANEKVYIAQKSGDQIPAIEASTNASVGGMVTGVTPQAVAVNEGSNRVYVANAGSTNLSVLNGTYLNHPPLQSSGFNRIDGTPGSVDVHVRPGDYEDMRIFVKMPFDVPYGCADASWNVSFVWTVRIHAS